MSKSFALVVSAIVGLNHMAEAIQFSDFTKIGSTGGYCVDNGTNLTPYTFARSPTHPFTTDAAMNDYCVGYCGQNLLPTFKGMNTYHLYGNATTFQCDCLFDQQTLPDKNKYTPTVVETEILPGTGNITGVSNVLQENFKCYSYSGTATGTNSPTGAPKPTGKPSGPASKSAKGTKSSKRV